MKKVFKTTILTLACMLAFAATAVAQPDYNDFEDVVSVNAVKSGGGVTATNIDAAAGETVEINMPGGSFAVDDNVSVGTISILLSQDIANGTFTLRPLSKPDQTPPAGSIAFFEIDTNIPDAAIEEAQITLIVDGVFTKVKLHRLTGGQWVALPTSCTDQGSSNGCTAETPGFSHFAITADKAAGDSSKLPFTGALPLYLAGGLGALLVAAGLTLKATKR